MARGVKMPGLGFHTSRQRTIRRGAPGQYTYRLMFSHNQGEPYIHVRFQHHEEHDVINVKDYAANEATIISRAEFTQRVTEYMADLSDSDLANFLQIARPTP